MEDYLMGSNIETWRERQAKTIAFVVTEDCSLACNYCYITGKNERSHMNLELAKAAVDFILNSSPDVMPEDSVIWDFICGEPCLEIDLIDQITEYIKLQMYKLSHRWFGDHRFSFTSSGTLYDSPLVQKYIMKNYNCISVGLSVNGNRITDVQQRNVPLWLEQFPNGSIKVAFSSDDLKCLKDGIINLWNLGIKDVNANVVFKHLWMHDADFLLETQLMELADYIIDNDLWSTHNCSFFSDTIGYPLTEERLSQNWCGAGKMLAIDYQGDLYSCMRFLEYSLNSRNGCVIGNIHEGLDQNKLKAFHALNTRSQIKPSCLDCQVASGCAWCQGSNCDEAPLDTIYEKSSYICKMHKARVRANEYYWAKLRSKSQITRVNSNGRTKQLSVKL